MTTAVSLGEFAIALLVALGSASLFAERLDVLGGRLGLSEALIGVLAAVAADGPELASAVTAMVRGEQDVGVGVVLGSNVFNIAAMIGGGALIAGAVRPRIESLAVESTVAVAIWVASAALLLRLISAPATLALIAVVLVPYIGLLLLGDRRLHLLPLPARAHGMLRTALGEGLAHHRPQAAHRSLWVTTAPMLAALAGIVGGSVVMVDAALDLADTAGLSDAVVGMVILAVLTSLPNAQTAIRLARQGRGDAVVSETLNSNTINLVFGIVIPAVVIGLGTTATAERADLLAYGVMMVVALLALARPGGAGRTTGAVLVVGYLLFALAQVAA